MWPPVPGDSYAGVGDDELLGVLSAVNAALRLAYGSYASVAVLIAQRVIGIKSFQDQASR